MSYSYTVPTVTIDPDSLDAKLAECVAAVPTGPGRVEAEAHKPVVVEAVMALAGTIDAGEFTASVSGHGNDGYTSLNLSVTKAS